MRKLGAPCFRWMLVFSAAVWLYLSFRPGTARELRVPGLRHATAHAQPALGALESTLPQAEDARVVLGRALFFDTDLSEPRGTSCASCHDPKQAYAGNHGSELGVAAGSKPGHYARRNTQSVMYLRFVRRFHMVWDDESDRPEAFGGFFWDGRADNIAQLVRQPLLNPNEMGNRSLTRVADKVRQSAYAEDLSREFDHVFASTEQTLEAVGFCLEAFLTSPAMSPFSSRFDDFVRGQASLTALELRGLALFQDPDKGACSGCHRVDTRTGVPESSLFTDFGYDAVAVPRNRKLPANHRASQHDLGVCERSDRHLHTEDPWFCGTFRTPSLRNVALRSSYMHNGYFSNLHDVVRFYATRATSPERWYKQQPFDDLPPRYRENVNVMLPPYDQLRGQTPRLDEADVDAIVAFLQTLSDRRVPAAP